MKRARVSEKDMEAFPEGAIWNAFVGLLAMSDSNELSSEQLPAQRAFWYDSEVQNGGHLQYFINRGVDEARSAVIELPRLGAAKYGDLLKRALAAWDEQARERPQTAQEYVDVALENEFGGFDAEYYAMTPTLIEVLEAHLSAHQVRFVLVD